MCRDILSRLLRGLPLLNRRIILSTRAAHHLPCFLPFQDPSLPCVRGFPNDHLEGSGETGWLASNINHLHPQRHHWQLGFCHLPAVQSRGDHLQNILLFLSRDVHVFNCVLGSPVFCLSGGSSWLSVWHPGLPVRGTVSELADPGRTLEGLHQASVCCHLSVYLRPVALD